ncbi:hypothetical protein E4U54_006282 [Claviceps lovelessii]|nr:hypothetical protein E4U54_006282 [Claviceps lovelessii]
MDFAPYQSSPPEHSRVSSPIFSTSSPRQSFDAATRRPFSPPSARSPPTFQPPQPQRLWTDSEEPAGGWPTSSRGARIVASNYAVAEISEFDTSLGLRLDYEACFAYLALPPLGSVILLILERNSDYVRFHAWQSALLFTTILVFHVFLSWSPFLSWVFFIGDIALIALLTLRAYRDAEVLDRYEVPFFGKIASRILNDE